MWNTLIAAPLSAWITISCLFLFLCLKYFASRWRRLRLPPGPRGLPFVGFMPFLSPVKPYEQLDRLRKTYGNVFGMNMGTKYYLVLGDLKSVKEAFMEDSFSTRPDRCFQFGDNCLNFASTYGQHWFDHRKLASKCLRTNLLDHEALESSLLDYVKIALDRLDRARRESKDGEVSLRVPITDATNGMSCHILCGSPSSSIRNETLRTIHRFQESFSEMASSITLERLVPWLKPLLILLFSKKKRMVQDFQKMEDVIWLLIETKEKDHPDKPRDYVQYYLHERSKPNMTERLSRPDLNGDLQMLLFASGDTVRATIEWYLMLMAKHQDIQERVYQEIREVLGASGTPHYDVRNKMPYTEATILDSMRLYTLTPFCPIHSTAKGPATQFQGHDIPGDSVVLANIWAVHHDPKNWTNPDIFYPDHFLSSGEGSVKIPETFIPFSIGKRICIGDKLALVEVFLFAVSFLQRFHLLPPDGGMKMDEKFNVTLEPLFPNVRLALRNETDM